MGQEKSDEISYPWILSLNPSKGRSKDPSEIQTHVFCFDGCCTSKGAAGKGKDFTGCLLQNIRVKMSRCSSREKTWISSRQHISLYSLAPQLWEAGRMTQSLLTGKCIRRVKSIFQSHPSVSHEIKILKQVRIIPAARDFFMISHHPLCVTLRSLLNWPKPQS